MSLTQTIITAVLGVLAAYRGALTRTSRLRGIIRADLELLNALPADHPSRATLTAHVGQLVDALTHREIRQFQPSTPPGIAFDFFLGSTVLWFYGFVLMLSPYGIEVVRVFRPEAVDPPYPVMPAMFATVAVLFAALAVRDWRRSRPGLAAPG